MSQKTQDALISLAVVTVLLGAGLGAHALDSDMIALMCIGAGVGYLAPRSRVAR